MAQGDSTVFDEAKLAFFDGTHTLGSDTIKAALIDNTTVPTASDATPALADYTQVTAGGNYVAGGATLTQSLTEAAGVVTEDFTTNPTWAKDAANPTNAYYALIYNSTNVGNEALGFVDLGGVYDMTTGDLNVAWHALGYFTYT